MAVDGYRDFRDFCAKHGGAQLKEGNVYYLPDGAQVVDRGAGDGEYQQLREPPADPEANIQARQTYLGLKLSRVEADFKEAKFSLLGFSETALPSWDSHTFGPPPQSADPIDHLRALQALAVELNEQLAALGKEYDALPSVVARRKAAAQAAEAARRRREAEAARRATIEALQLPERVR